MARFRATFVEPSGASRTEILDGPSAQFVMALLEQRGARFVSVLEEFLSAEGRDLAAESLHAARRAPPRLAAVPPGGEAKADLVPYIEERLDLPPPKPGLTPARAARGWFWQAAAFGTAAWLTRPSALGLHGSRSGLTAAVVLATLTVGALSVAPLWLDFRARHARAWRDWPALLRWTALASWLPSVRSKPALRYGFGTLRAAALAGTGRVDEALALVERVGGDNKVASSVIDSAKAGVYLAINDYDRAIELRRRVAEDPARVGARVDLAIALLEYRRDAAGAREQLAEVVAPPTSLIEAAFRSLAVGLLDLEQGRPTDAVVTLRRARRAFERDVPRAAIEGILLWTDPFLCLALAQSGGREQARRLLPRVARYLKATSQPAWLERCNDALGQSAPDLPG